MTPADSPPSGRSAPHRCDSVPSVYAPRPGQADGCRVRPASSEPGPPAGVRNYSIWPVYAATPAAGIAPNLDGPFPSAEASPRSPPLAGQNGPLGSHADSQALCQLVGTSPDIKTLVLQLLSWPCPGRPHGGGDQPGTTRHPLGHSGTGRSRAGEPHWERLRVGASCGPTGRHCASTGERAHDSGNTCFQSFV